MANDPVKNFYLKGYADAKAGKKSQRNRVPYNFKLSYVSGRCDAYQNKTPRYEETTEKK
jgi:hypothetical protein